MTGGPTSLRASTRGIGSSTTRQAQYVKGDIYTNTIEGFFGNLKTGMRGAYKKVSSKWLQSYVDEYAWRHNHRYHGRRSMFHAALKEASK